MHSIASSKWEHATTWLLTGAIFFAMRSCEYLETNANEASRRTKILRLKNITFKTHDGRLLRADSQAQDLESSELVIVTFEFQKNDKRDVQVHMFRTNDNILNPVVAWAKTVLRVRSYKDTTMDSKVCTFLQDSNLSCIHSDHARIWLRSTTDLIGDSALGFTKDAVGLHSIRSGGAMAMFMSGISTVIIQRIGRWSSEAFLEYIRDQIESFTLGVSQKMIEVSDFHHLSSQSTDPTKLNNENGPDQVPIQVAFSQLALEGNTQLE
jgi:hypothetical protein